MKKTTKGKNTKPTKPAPRPVAEPMITTQDAMGRWLNLSRQAVNSMVAHRRWPFGKGPWPQSLVPKIQDWRRDNLRLNQTGDWDGGSDPAADDVPGWTAPDEALTAALLARYPVHARFFVRVALSLIVELDKHADDEADQEAIDQSRDSMPAMKLVSLADVREFSATGTLPHLKDAAAVEAADHRLKRRRAESIDGYRQTMECLEADQGKRRQQP